MKNILNKIAVLGLLFVAFSCVEAEDLVTKNVAAPVLVVLEGTEFDATTGVAVSGSFYELDKTGILDRNVGIDSIPVSGLEVKVFINQTDEVGTLTTDTQGKILFQNPWSSLGIAQPTSGTQIRLEFTGTYNDIAFRRFHNVRVR
ncbi:hypothetical protein SAMN05192553_104309 [Cyclobacterium xiamenense]|jgi:hypothetical protein|uniref:Uncharacterized protein n=1 Tax=Cyclobacterium xiamenense TaxID=1297121 RepID=A0A1H6Z8G3_9BACT|nr:hypothetical protein [Cyclobacterium xiamenense]SEJ49883.1 hypothetical protein SAMN05192553_104309 [Cyclobacterium xiamenense]